MEGIHRVGVKIFCESSEPVELQEFIPIFHRWIQTSAVEGMLIDVADYSHMSDGPGILLVAHEGIYGIDETGGRRGLVYYQRQSVAGSLGEALGEAARLALAAGAKLAEESEMAGRLRFRSDELLVFANDRLRAPNSDETLRLFEPALAELVATLYPGAECSITREADQKEKFAVSVTSPTPAEGEPT